LSGPRCRSGRAVNEVCDRFGLCKVDFSVQKSALTEFPRAGEPAFQLDQSFQDEIKDHGTAVGMKLKDVFAGKGMWRWKIKGEALIDRLAMLIEKPPKGGIAGFWYFSKQRR